MYVDAPYGHSGSAHRLGACLEVGEHASPRVDLLAQSARTVHSALYNDRARACTLNEHYVNIVSLNSLKGHDFDDEKPSKDI